MDTLVSVAVGAVIMLMGVGFGVILTKSARR